MQERGVYRMTKARGAKDSRRAGVCLGPRVNLLESAVRDIESVTPIAPLD